MLTRSSSRTTPGAPRRRSSRSNRGARTAWHTHPLGQTLIVTSGLGRVQREGGPVEEIRPGDVVWFEPGEKHWHGAAPNNAMGHIAIQENLDGKVVDWMTNADTVRADDYLIVDVARAREQLAARAEALRDAERMIESVKGVVGGEPVFKRTRVPVRTIAAMKAQGASTVEIIEGYPSLTERIVELAEIWVAAHPARGRPRRLSEQGLKVKSEKRLRLRRESVPKPSGSLS